MAKLKLVPDPAFVAPVPIPVHGAEAVPVNFTFKHRTREALQAWRESLSGKTDTALVLEMVTGWDLDDEFNEDNVERLNQNYAGAATAIFEVYLAEIVQARLKNSKP